MKGECSYWSQYFVTHYEHPSGIKSKETILVFQDQSLLLSNQIVLIQNGVFWAIHDKIDSYLDKGIEIYAIAPDLFARGYSEEVSKVPLLSYDGFIELLENAEQNLG